MYRQFPEARFHADILVLNWRNQVLNTQNPFFKLGLSASSRFCIVIDHAELYAQDLFVQTNFTESPKKTYAAIEEIRNMPLKDETLSKSISVTIANGNKLLDDAKFLFEFDRCPTALALSVLAQEEFAKAFLLRLVLDDALPWLPEVQRSMARHQCKHLLAMVMEWLPPFDFAKNEERNKGDKVRHEQKMEWLQRRMDRYKQETSYPIRMIQNRLRRSSFSPRM
jgi:AbiV family abortive infection protein